jgi:hypothetical protein
MKRFKRRLLDRFEAERALKANRMDENASAPSEHPPSKS